MQICNLRLKANIFVCTVLTDLLTRICWKLIYMYVIRWFMPEIIALYKITIGSCKCMQLAIICKYICVHGFDWSPTWFCWKWIYIYVLRWCMSEIIIFFNITIGICKFMQLAIICNIFVSTVLTDLLTQFYWKFIYIYITCLKLL